MGLEFSKKLLILDYVILIVMVVLWLTVARSLELSIVISAWIAQIGVSSAAYYSKAKKENQVKVPLKVIQSLPEDTQDKLDLTQIITTIVQSE